MKLWNNVSRLVSHTTANDKKRTIRRNHSEWERQSDKDKTTKIMRGGAVRSHSLSWQPYSLLPHDTLDCLFETPAVSTLSLQSQTVRSHGRLGLRRIEYVIAHSVPLTIAPFVRRGTRILMRGKGQRIIPSHSRGLRGSE